MYKIVYLPDANADLADALRYISVELDSPSAAEKLLQEFEAAIKTISEFPYAFELYRTDKPMADEIRKVPVKNYVLYYAVFEDRVEIRRFIHGRKDRSKIAF